mmetsp:Transcript_149997/g.482059  ORF Transcript_149997/g.482059 Transcript_149997/m.482059 type:complete len:403 (-) Transcript_149997:82-1290(-)
MRLLGGCCAEDFQDLGAKGDSSVEANLLSTSFTSTCSEFEGSCFSESDQELISLGPSPVGVKRCSSGWCSSSLKASSGELSFLEARSTDFEGRSSPSDGHCPESCLNERIKLSLLHDFDARYDLGEAIGEGAYATVYKALDKQSDHKVAVKTIESEERALVEVEVSSWHDLEHPHIVKLHGVYHADKRWHLVMDLCTGGDLHAFVADYVATCQRYSSRDYSGGLSTDIAARFMSQMLMGVAFLHERGIVHRDIKPENYLLVTRGSRSPLKLTDFGFASRIRPDEKLHRGVGTQFYAAPELLAGSYDQRADLWSLGVTGYVACTWHLPFEGYDEQEYDTNASLGRRRSREDAWWAQHEPRMRALVDKLLQPDPDCRPQAVEALEAHTWLEEYNRRADGFCTIS